MSFILIIELTEGKSLQTLTFLKELRPSVKKIERGKKYGKLF